MEASGSPVNVHLIQVVLLSGISVNMLGDWGPVMEGYWRAGSGRRVCGSGDLSGKAAGEQDQEVGAWESGGGTQWCASSCWGLDRGYHYHNWRRPH